VYYGLKNDGCKVIAKRINKKPHRIPIAASIAKTNSAKTAETAAGIADYAKAFLTMAPVADFFVINISCPNAFGGEPFSSPERLELLLSAIDPIPTQKPIFLKLSADTALETLDELLAVIKRHRVHGFIATNLTKKRDIPGLAESERGIGKGGISGRPMFNLSNKLLGELYKRTQGNYVLIGTGGIFSAEDAYKKIRLGASLVQLITGMIYEGPQLIGQINRGLAELLKRDGYTHISQAVGAAHRERDKITAS
jgi:dihydroorotate dehydrogenase